MSNGYTCAVGCKGVSLRKNMRRTRCNHRREVISFSLKDRGHKLNECGRLFYENQHGAASPNVNIHGRCPEATDFDVAAQGLSDAGGKTSVTRVFTEKKRFKIIFSYSFEVVSCMRKARGCRLTMGDAFLM